MIFLMFTSIRGNDPPWLAHIFQMSWWKTHQFNSCFCFPFFWWDRYHIITQLAVYTTYIATWGMIYHLPPINQPEGTNRRAPALISKAPSLIGSSHGPWMPCTTWERNSWNPSSNWDHRTVVTGHLRCVVWQRVTRWFFWSSAWISWKMCVFF